MLYYRNRNVLQWDMRFTEAHRRNEHRSAAWSVWLKPWPAFSVPNHFSFFFFTQVVLSWLVLAFQAWLNWDSQVFCSRLFFQISASWGHLPFNNFSSSGTVLFKIPIYPYLFRLMDTPQDPNTWERGWNVLKYFCFLKILILWWFYSFVIRKFSYKKKKIKLTISCGSEYGGELFFWLSLTMLSITCLSIYFWTYSCWEDMSNATRPIHLIVCTSVCVAHFTLMSVFTPWATNWSSQIPLPNTESQDVFERGLWVRITESNVTLLEESIGNQPIYCLPSYWNPNAKYSLYAQRGWGWWGVCDIQPREELLSNCVLPSGCLQLPVMFCFDDGNSSILCSQGSLCVSCWVYVVCIDFSIELVWSYQLRCQTHLLLQSEFIFVNQGQGLFF